MKEELEGLKGKKRFKTEIAHAPDIFCDYGLLIQRQFQQLC
jgi:hypothetical protein